MSNIIEIKNLKNPTKMLRQLKALTFMLKKESSLHYLDLTVQEKAQLLI